MIATLSGLVAEKIAQLVVLEVGGVGYGVLMPLNDQGTLITGQEVRLHIHEHIKEDSHDLYGFLTLDAKRLYEQLLTVKNVGPKVALAVLDVGTLDAVRSAIATGNVKVLQTAKGVGKRAAEQMVVELRDKVGVPVGGAAEGIVGRPGVDLQDEAMQALVSLGYSESDAMMALDGVDRTLSTEDRIRQVLKGGR